MEQGALRLDGPLARKHRAQGVGHGPRILVFSHGLGTDQSAWAGVVASLPDDCTALLLDLPGASPQPPDDFDAEDYRTLAPYADDILALLDEVGVARCTFIGHSISSMIGIMAAIEAPALFERLIFLNASPYYITEPGYEGSYDDAALTALFDAMTTNYQAWVAGFAPRAVDADAPLAVESFSACLLAMRPDLTAGLSRSVFASDMRPLLPQLIVPTTLLYTRAGIGAPVSVAHYMDQHIADSHLVWLDAPGHLPHLSAPDEVARTLWSHLD